MGYPLRFAIQAKDQAGHDANYSPLATSGYAFHCVATLVKPGRGAQPEALEVVGDMVDHSDGTLSCSLHFKKAGTYEVRVEGEDGGELQGSPFTVSAAAAGMDARFCKLDGAGLKGGVAGRPCTFTIQVRRPLCPPACAQPAPRHRASALAHRAPRLCTRSPRATAQALDRHGNVCYEKPEAEVAQATRFAVTLVPIKPAKSGSRRPASPPKAQASPRPGSRGTTPRTAAARPSLLSARSGSGDAPGPVTIARDLGLVHGSVRSQGSGLYAAEYVVTKSGLYELRVVHSARRALLPPPAPITRTGTRAGLADACRPLLCSSPQPSPRASRAPRPRPRPRRPTSLARLRCPMQASTRTRSRWRAVPFASRSRRRRRTCPRASACSRTGARARTSRWRSRRRGRWPASSSSRGIATSTRAAWAATASRCCSTGPSHWRARRWTRATAPTPCATARAAPANTCSPSPRTSSTSPAHASA